MWWTCHSFQTLWIQIYDILGTLFGITIPMLPEGLPKTNLYWPMTNIVTATKQVIAGARLLDSLSLVAVKSTIHRMLINDKLNSKFTNTMRTFHKNRGVCRF